MKILFGSDSIIIAILTVVVNWFRRWAKKKLNVDIPETIIWKMYYEMERFSQKNKLGRILETIDEEQFIQFLQEFIDVLDEEKPTFLLNNKLAWDIFVIVKDYLNKDWIKNSFLLGSFKNAINQKIINTPELLDYRIKRDVDEAIKDYQKLEKEMFNEPIEPTIKTIETVKENKQNPFGFDEIRIRGDWVDE
jgi:hypothetical protein